MERRGLKRRQRRFLEPAIGMGSLPSSTQVQAPGREGMQPSGRDCPPPTASSAAGPMTSPLRCNCSHRDCLVSFRRKDNSPIFEVPEGCDIGRLFSRSIALHGLSCVDSFTSHFQVQTQSVDRMTDLPAGEDAVKTLG